MKSRLPDLARPGRPVDRSAAGLRIPQRTPASRRLTGRHRTASRRAAALPALRGGDLNFAEHPGCIGLGLIGKNNRPKGTLGLHMHSTLAVSGDGIPPGGAADPVRGAGRAGGDKHKPLEELKTDRWLCGLQDCAALAAELEGVRPVSVMDLEGDVFALFVARRPLDTVDLLVRAKHNRSLGRGVPKLFDKVRGEPEQGREVREERVAQAGLRWLEVELADPEWRKPAVRLNLVHVREESEPAGAERC